MNKTNLLISAFIAVVSLCSANAGEAAQGEVDVIIRLAEQPYYLGEPMLFEVVVTNRSTERGVFFYHHRGDRDTQRSGMIFSLTHAESGSNLTPRCGIGLDESHFGRLCSDTLKGDLQRIFGELEGGHYKFFVGIVDFLVVGRMAGGKEVVDVSKTLDIQSASVEFEVRGVDEAEAARVDGLLRSGARRDVLEGLGRLEGARTALFRREVPALPPLVRSRDAAVRTAALRVLLVRVELTGALADAELYEALDAASREPDAALRLAAARALIRIRNQLGRGDMVRTYDSKRLRDWYEGETSDECRSLLVSVNTLPLEFRVKVAQRDTSPHVRAVAVRWLSDFAPGNLLKVADSFGKLSGEVEMDGKRQPLAAFVSGEVARAKSRVVGANAR